ncbi:MAG: DUF3108 domain-containing protein [Paludibacteraceae bacterium]|jgi:Protein of unknown function (DUF3108).|nr:DUF3108 domain-containing protein [Paludibacteraceae bacterium]
MKRKLIFIISLLFVLASAFSSDQYMSDEIAFKDGERATYYIYYNLGPIWLHAGNVNFSVKERKAGKESLFDLQLAGSSTKSFDRFYCIRDTYSVTVRKEGLLPLHYREVKHEDSYFSDNHYRFDWKENDKDSKVYFEFNKRGRMSYDTLSVQRGVLDLITSCYHIRSVDMTKVKKGQSIPFRLVLDKKIYDLTVKYSGEETIKLKNKKKYKALKFTPKLVTGDIFEDEDAMTIYVSNDENHVPLYIEAKIKVGYVKVMLNDIQNTKSPMSSDISK